MKNTIKFLSVISLMLVIGFSMTSCSNGGAPVPVPKGKSITITEITGKTGDAGIILYDSEGSEAASGEAAISGETVKFDLKDANGKSWTGKCSYYLILGLGEDDEAAMYVYTRGQSLLGLGISS
jgi:hypothetical protein